MSKAVRTPSRGETDAVFSIMAFPSPVPVVVDLIGNKEFASEELLAYEIGYRFVPAKKFSVDATLFYNEYDNIRTGVELPPDYSGMLMGRPIRQGLLLSNGISLTTVGGELAVSFQPSELCKLDLAYSVVKPNKESIGGFPRHQVSLRSQINPSDTLELDVWLRYVDEASASYLRAESSSYAIDGYVTMDLRLGWQITPQVELSLVGQNLLDGEHMEFVQETFGNAIEIERSFYGKLTYLF